MLSPQSEKRLVERASNPAAVSRKCDAVCLNYLGRVRRLLGSLGL